MGLKSLIAVAQGKNAESVSFEDKFLKNYEEAVKAKELEERQVAPSEYIRPSSMYGCERMLFFQRVHGGSQNGEQSEVNHNEICQSGTDRHLDIQHIVERMEGVECLDLEEMVKEAQAKGIKTDLVSLSLILQDLLSLVNRELTDSIHSISFFIRELTLCHYSSSDLRTTS